MKKVAKIPLIVVSSVVGAILIAVIVLCSVSIRPLKDFSGYSEVRLTTQSRSLPNGTLKNEFGGKIDKNMKKAGFSVMHATLEFVGSYGPKFVYEENEDGECVQRSLTIAEAIEECAPTEDSYRLEFKYDEVRTYKVGKTKVEYDNMVMNVKTTSGELRWVNIYLYLGSMKGAINSDSDEYRVHPIRLRMNTSPLYIALGEIDSDPIWG